MAHHGASHRDKYPDDPEELITVTPEMAMSSTRGMCITCKQEVEGVEPDAESYTCPHCMARTVYGIEQLVLMGKARIREP